MDPTQTRIIANISQGFAGFTDSEGHEEAIQATRELPSLQLGHCC